MTVIDSEGLRFALLLLCETGCPAKPQHFIAPLEASDDRGACVDTAG